jgi:hypothetical protein
MLEVLLGSKRAKRALAYIFSRQEGYPRGIARVFKTGSKSIHLFQLSV